MVKNIYHTLIKKIRSFLNKSTNLQVGLNNEKDRVKWIKSTLKKIPSGKRILDAGAGEQQFKKFCMHLEYVSQDIAQYDGKGEKGLQTGKWSYGKLDIISDIIDIPVPDASFDAIMCTEVLEHVPNPVAAINELDRVLKKGGYFIITAPFCSLTHFAPFHYCTGFNSFFFRKILDELDYEILELSPNGNYFEYLGQELRRLKSVSKRYTGEQIGLRTEKNINNLLCTLSQLSNIDQGSSELLCFGFHVFALKR